VTEEATELEAGSFSIKAGNHLLFKKGNRTSKRDMYDSSKFKKEKVEETNCEHLSFSDNDSLSNRDDHRDPIQLMADES
jgi:hypothetical protein